MENKETSVLIKAIEQKESAKGNLYWGVKTDQGTFTVFDTEPVEILKENIGKNVIIEYRENDRGFKNIKKASLKKIEVEKVETKNEAIKEARSAKDTSIYTSYVKDLIVSGIDKDLAIATIKQIREEFK